MEFWKIYRLVKARRWMILGLLLITLLTVFVAKKAVDEQTQYTAVALVLPDQDAMSDKGIFQDGGRAEGGVQSLVGPSNDRLTRIATFTQDIRSRLPDAATLASKSQTSQKQAVVASLSSQITQQDAQQLGWINYPSAPNDSKTLNKVLSHFDIPTDDAFWTTRLLNSADLDQINLTAEPFVDSTITQGQDSGVITNYLKIMVVSPDRNLTVQMANLVATSFINDYHEQGTAEYKGAIDNLRRAKTQAEAELSGAQDALVNFRSKNQYLDTSTSVSTGVGNLVGLQRSLEQAQQQLQVANEAVTTLQQLATRTGPSLVVPLNPMARPQAQQLQSQIADAQATINTLSAQYTDANPLMIRAKAALAAKQQELKQILSQPYVLASGNGEFNSLHQQADQERATAARAQAMISSLNSQIAKQVADNKKLPETQKMFLKLSDDIDTAEQDKAVADANLISMSKTKMLLDQGLISLASPATEAVPDSSGPSLPTLLLYGAILSLIIGIGLALGLDYLDNSVQTIPDAERLLGMPVSAVIPAMPAGDPRRMTRLTVSDPLSPIAESYRLLRTDLLFTAEEKPFQSLMAATAKPGQGATTTICNLAVALATVGKRVILIDADLRRPKLHDFFSVSNEKGLTSVLNGECELEEALKVTDIDNLLILPSGPLPLNPAELLASQKMRSLHERLKPHTDFVLVDTPSAIAFSDSSILASYLDAVMIVVRAQETPRGSEMQLKNLLNKARANVVGVVLNGVKPQLVDSYFYHAAYYPQVSPGHTLGISNGAITALPNNGSHGQNGGPRTLEAESLDQAFEGHPSNGQDIETTAILDDDIVSVAPPQARSRFSIRKMFGNEDRD